MIIRILYFLIFIGSIFHSNPLVAKPIDLDIHLTDTLEWDSITIANTVNAGFFTKYPNLINIGITYLDNKADMLITKDQNKDYGGRNKTQMYDLLYPGDYLIFENIYSKIDLLSDSIVSKYKINKENRYLTNVIYTKDNIKFFYINVKPELFYGLGNPAKYLGDTKKVERLIAKKLKKNRSVKVIDSVLLFEARITKYNYVKEMRLSIGDSSKLADEILKIYNGPRKYGKNVEWESATCSGLYHDSLFRIYVRLQPNGNVEIAYTPRFLYFFDENQYYNPKIKK